MANSIYKLDLPEPFDWATNSGTTTDPGASRKATGFQLATRAPAKHFNWIFNIVGQWTQVMARSIINTFSFSAPPLLLSVVPDNLVWMGSYWWFHDGANTYYSNHNSTLISAGTALTFTPETLKPVKDSTGRLLMAEARYIKYATDPTGGSWSTTTAAMTPTDDISAIGIELGGDRVIAGGAHYGILGYANDVTGSWTNPSLPWVGTPSVISIKHMGGTVWFAATDDGQTATSINNGVAWSLTTAQPSSELNFSLLSDADINEVTGTICAFGETTTSEVPIYRSTDLGTSWVNTNTNVLTSPTSKRIRHFGGPLWMAIVDESGPATDVVLVSADDGLTWNELLLGGAWDTATANYLYGIYDMDCDGHTIRGITKGAGIITSGGV